jgi:uncharacterized membrane protein YcaP (DUF421 family)
MEKDDVKLNDITRILFGDAPAEYLLEVFVRSVIAYIVLLVIIKLLGKRMSGRLTPTEMAVMLMFGAIVSSAMQIPDRGVLEGIFVLFLVLAIQRLTTLWTVKKRKAEDLVLGNMSMLIKEGVLQLHELEGERISRHQLFAKLRAKGIKQLGEVKRLYMEVNGALTLYKKDPLQPGLSVFPADDTDVLKEQEPVTGKKVCYQCGHVYAESELPAQCYHCHSDRFVEAVK